jgi:iron complex outermembrane receptor protein
MLSLQSFGGTDTLKISGRVLDQQTREPLEGAFVKTENPDQSGVSRGGGYFNIITLSDSLIVSFTGYQTRIIPLRTEGQMKNINGTIELEILLMPEDALLRQVVVSADRDRKKITETTISIESIKPYLVENKNPISLENTVEQIPSVTVTDGQVNIRGGSGWSYGTGSRVMVLVDGLPMLSGDAGAVLWSFITTENIKDIEVIKGASSVLFGSAALNGIINIQTKRPEEKPFTSITQFYGVYDKPKRKTLNWQGNDLLSTAGFRSFHSFKKGANEWAFTTNLLNDDGYRMGDYERRGRLGTQFRHVPVGKNRMWGLNFNIQQGESASFLLWQSYDSAYTALNQAITKNQTFRLNLDPYLIWFSAKTRHHIKTRFLMIDNNIDNGNSNKNQSNKSALGYAEYQISHDLKSVGIKLVGGAVGMYTETNSPLFQGNQMAGNMAAYVQAEKKWNRLIFSVGGRMENYSLNEYKETKPVLRSGLNYRLAKYSFLRASFGQGYRFPTIGESLILTNVGMMAIYPNPSLKSETGWNSEIGVKQGYHLGKIRGFIDIAGYWTQYNNMIEFTFGQWSSNTFADSSGFKSLNVGNSRIRGLDFSINGEGPIGPGNIIMLGGYTFMDAISLEPDKVLVTDVWGDDLTFKNTSSDTAGNILKYRPKHIAKLDVQYTMPKWDMGISIRFSSYIDNIDRAFVNVPLSFFIRDIQKGRDDTKNGVFVFDLRAGYKVRKNYKISLVVLNIFNLEYMTRPADIQAPRSYSLQMVWRFQEGQDK